MPTARTRSAATRSSFRPASTTWSTTFCTSCSRACLTRRSAPKGISLFIVPKFQLREDGSRGERNGVVCTGIEEKMGIHGNATCALSFERSIGYLVGAENEGMRCMFTMMNAARLGVGVQGVGLAEAAYQASLDVRARTFADAQFDRTAESRWAGGSDHRASGRAADAADAESADRRWPGACVLHRAAGRSRRVRTARRSATTPRRC